MNDILILPSNEQELFEHYFDVTKYAALKDRHTLLHKAIHNSLPIQERRRYKLTGDVSDLVKEHRQLTRQLFQAAMLSFAERVCEEQREICEMQYWNAPSGEEPEHIIAARMPDIGDDPILFTRIGEWWISLACWQMKEIVADFKDDFGCVYTDDNNDLEIEESIEKRWQSLPLESRKRIYNYYNQ